MKRLSPEENERIFERISRSALPEYRNDPEFKQLALMFLELGGESLTRQYIEICGKPFPERLTLFDKPLEDDAFKEDTEELSEEDSEEED